VFQVGKFTLEFEEDTIIPIFQFPEDFIVLNVLQRGFRMKEQFPIFTIGIPFIIDFISQKKQLRVY
jgi:hypothetical protein